MSFGSGQFGNSPYGSSGEPDPSTPFKDAVLTDSPVAYYRFEGGSTSQTDYSGNSYTGTLVGTVSKLVPGITPDEDDAAVRFSPTANDAGFYAELPSEYTDGTASGIYSIELVVRVPEGANNGVINLLHLQSKGSEYKSNTNGGRGAGISAVEGEYLEIWCVTSANEVQTLQIPSSTFEIFDWSYHHIVVKFLKHSTTKLRIKVFADDAEIADELFDETGIAEFDETTGTPQTVSRTYMGGSNHLALDEIAPGGADGIYIDELALYDTELSDARVSAHFALLNHVPSYFPDSVPIQWDFTTTYIPPSVPIRWRFVDTYTPPAVPIKWEFVNTYTPDAVPIRWNIPTIYTPDAVPIRWNFYDSGHYAGTAAAWGAEVYLDGVDIFDRLTGQIVIEAEESASTIARFEYVPESGALDPADYENKTVYIDFVGYDSGGSVIYQSRRFTGVTAIADYEPDRGVLNIEATTDLQNRLLQMSRANIDSLIGGYWSEHVFDESVSNYQYALDRLSTTASEIHIDRTGKICVVEWAAKSTEDIELTDAGRFANTLRLNRANRNDLLNSVTLEMEFRYEMLRQREVGVSIACQYSLCDFLINPWHVLQRSQVESAANSGQWTRIGNIHYTPIWPSQGTFCINRGPAFWIGWVAGDQSLNCLGASWKAGKRWAQTVTETASITVTCSDSVSSYGSISVSENYGIEAEYETDDWETLPFETAPEGFSKNPAGDYAKEATEDTRNGRDAYEVAQQTAIAKARTEILDRHRGNRVDLVASYRPDIDLSKTIKITTDYLTAKGKLAGFTETMDIDTGRIDMGLSIALSRNGGGSSASDDAINAITPPDPVSESQYQTHASHFYHIGGYPEAVPYSEEWTGFITNRQVASDGGNKLYNRALKIEYPEIEESARENQELTASGTISVAIPNDTLVMSA